MSTTHELHLSEAFVGAIPDDSCETSLMKQILTPAIIAIGLCFAATGVSAQTLETGVPGLVVKNLACIDLVGLHSPVTLNVVNRSNQPVTGTLFVDILDQENDPVDGFALGVRIDRNSGRLFKQLVEKCYGGKFRVEFKAD